MHAQQIQRVAVLHAPQGLGHVFAGRPVHGGTGGGTQFIDPPDVVGMVMGD